MDYKNSKKEAEKEGLVVIMGPTSSGKSCVLKEIGNRGYDFYEEIPKQVLSEREGYIREGDSPEKVKKEIETRERIMYQRQSKLEDQLMKKKNKISFVERSLAGVFGFTNHYLGYIPEDFDMNQDFSNRYLKVFNLQDLGDFKKEATRVEKDKDEAKKVHETVLKHYDYFGINYVNVGVFSDNEKENIKKRADFILDTLDLPYWNK